MDDENITQQVGSELQQANEQIINAIARTDDPTIRDRRFRIAQVRTEMEESGIRTASNAIICVLSSTAFLACSIYTARQLGINNTDLEVLKQGVDTVVNTSGVLDGIEQLISNIGTFNEAMKEIFTLDNLKGMLSELGPVGYISGILSTVSLMRTSRNLHQGLNARREYDTLDAMYHEDCEQVRQAFVAQYERRMEQSLFQRVSDSIHEYFYRIEEERFNRQHRSERTLDNTLNSDDIGRSR